MTVHNSQPGKIPDHIPKHLIQDFPLKMGVYADENPFDRIVPEVCEGPDVIYALDVLPGGRGDAWIFRRQEDNRETFFQQGLQRFCRADRRALVNHSCRNRRTGAHLFSHPAQPGVCTRLHGENGRHSTRCSTADPEAA